MSLCHPIQLAQNGVLLQVQVAQSCNNTGLTPAHCVMNVMHDSKSRTCPIVIRTMTLRLQPSPATEETIQKLKEVSDPIQAIVNKPPIHKYLYKYTLRSHRLT